MSIQGHTITMINIRCSIILGELLKNIEKILRIFMYLSLSLILNGVIGSLEILAFIIVSKTNGSSDIHHIHTCTEVNLFVIRNCIAIYFVFGV